MKIKAKKASEIEDDGFSSGDGLGFDVEEGLKTIKSIMNGETPPDRPSIKAIKAEKVLTTTPEFDPEIDGDTASELMKNMGRLWIEKAVILGEIISRAKDFYQKDKGGLEDWLEGFCRIKYPMAMQLIRVSKMQQETINLIIERGFTSSHVIKLLSLKYEEEQVDFLELEEHPIDEDDTLVKTAEMTAKDVQDAIKLINKKPEPEISPTEEFFKVIKAIESVLDKTSDAFAEYVVDNDSIDLSELSQAQIGVLESARRLMKAQTEDYLNVMKKLAPVKETKICAKIDLDKN
jgi:hypothetical protein